MKDMLGRLGRKFAVSIMNTKKWDGYKGSHYKFDPTDLTYKSFYAEAREKDMPVVVFRFQELVVSLAKFADFEIKTGDKEFFKAYGMPLNIKGFQLLKECYPDGNLPLHIQVIRQGTVTRSGIPVLQVTNTDPRFSWLPGLFENWFLQGHDAASVATQSFVARDMIIEGMEKSCDDLGKLPWMLNDFGVRAVTCMEAAAIKGSGHSVFFLGSDNTPAGELIQENYGTTEVFINTIPATEHSIMTLEPREREHLLVRSILEKFIRGDINGEDDPDDDLRINGPIMAMVIDSYDDENFVKDIIFNKCLDLVRIIESQGKCIVLRPDSGDSTTKVIDVMNWIEECIPDEIAINTKGYKKLPAFIATIQGDGISIMTGKKTLQTLINNIIDAGWALDNTCFGSGGALLNGMDRDTMGWCFKLSAKKVEGSDEWIPLGKETPGKVSKKGRLAVIMDAQGHLQYIQEADLGDRKNYLETIYDEGLVLSAVMSFQQTKDKAATYRLADVL